MTSIRTTGGILLALCPAIFTLACSDRDTPVPTAPPAFGAPHATVLEDTDCPPDVRPEDCRPATQIERDDLFWDIKIGIKWYDTACASVGYDLLDFAKYGDVRIYPDSAGRPLGTFVRYLPSGSRRISINANMWQQGWASGARARTFMHEGHHDFFDSDDTTSSPEDFAYYCVNN
jgi:hypothetical protein